MNTIREWPCKEDVLFDYFSGKGHPCTEELIKNTISKIMSDFPDHHIYLGITHHPCARWKGGYSSMLFILPSHLNKDFFYIEKPYTESLNERYHKQDFEKMFVICYRESEAAIRDMERVGIRLAKNIDAERVVNDTEGGNGKLSKNQKYYFLYVCITKNVLLTESTVLEPLL